MFKQNRTVVETRHNVLLAGITDMINQVRHFPVSQKAVKRRLYENNYHRRIIRKKIRICDENHKKVCHGQEERDFGELKENGME